MEPVLDGRETVPPDPITVVLLASRLCFSSRCSVCPPPMPGGLEWETRRLGVSCLG